MYKTHIVKNRIIITNSEIKNLDRSFKIGTYIAVIHINKFEFGFKATTWSQDYHFDFDKRFDLDRTDDLLGESLEQTFLMVQIVLDGYGFEGIMDLELPEEMLDAL